MKDTQIYLTKINPGHELSIKLDTNLLDDTLHTLYDVKVGTNIVIPRGSKVKGNWISETVPVIAVQLQLTSICIDGGWVPIMADSEIFRSTTLYNINEVHNANNIRRLLTFKSTANIIRRVVDVRCQTKVLPDTLLLHDGELYVSIFTDEIQVTLLKDFCC